VVSIHALGSRPPAPPLGRLACPPEYAGFGGIEWQSNGNVPTAPNGHENMEALEAEWAADCADCYVISNGSSERSATATVEGFWGVFCCPGGQERIDQAVSFLQREAFIYGSDCWDIVLEYHKRKYDTVPSGRCTRLMHGELRHRFRHA
jgi:hypothetical protein